MNRRQNKLRFEAQHDCLLKRMEIIAPCGRVLLSGSIWLSAADAMIVGNPYLYSGTTFTVDSLLLGLSSA